MSMIVYLYNTYFVFTNRGDCTYVTLEINMQIYIYKYQYIDIYIYISC